MRRTCIALALIIAVTMTFTACSSKSGDAGKTTKSTKASADPKQKAVDMAEDAVKQDPKSPVAHRNLASAYLAAASPASGEEPPKNREELVDKAVAELEKAVELDSNNLDLISMLGSTYMSAHDYDKATSTLGQVAQARKNDINVWYQWGLAASNAGDTDITVKAWEHFLMIAPKGDTRIKPTKAALKSIKEAKTAK